MKERTPIFQLMVDQATPETAAVTLPASFVIPDDWHSQHMEGQLSVDVFETRDALLVVAPVAGIDAGQVEIYIHNDLLTLRGKRVLPVAGAEIVETYCSECFWGICSRTIVLPVHVKGDLATAEHRHGVLTVRIPKATAHMHVPITVVEE
jgi:HSP20 family protein